MRETIQCEGKRARFSLSRCLSVLRIYTNGLSIKFKSPTFAEYI